MLTFRLCRNAEGVDFWAGFFVRHVTESYISHSELQTFRTDPDGHWSPNLLHEIRSELQVCAEQANVDRATVTRWNGAFTVQRNGQPAGIAVTLYDRTGPSPFGIIEDLLVAEDMRGEGIGTALINHVLDDMRQMKLSRVFIESGINNEGAHTMFKRRGFESVSIVMSRSLRDG